MPAGDSQYPSCLYIDPVTLCSLFFLGSSHLGMNPFHCDCNLLWMAEYLREKPVDLSEAKCETPRRWSKRKITAMDANKVKCTRGKSGQSIMLSHWAV